MTAVWGYRGRCGGKINIVIIAGNDKKIRVMSRVKAPKWAPISPYYRDVMELRDGMDERRIQWRTDRRWVIGGMEDMRKYVMDKIGKLRVWRIMNIALGYEFYLYKW